ncbi:hypothetical protein V8E51_019549 [Hyaloscypha variabilis]
MIGCGYFGSLKRANYAIAAACRQPLAWSYGCPTAAAQERRRSKNNPTQHRPSYLGHEGQDPSFRGQPLNQRQVTTFVEVYCRDARVEKESLLPVKFSTLRQGRIEEFIRRCSDHLGAFEFADFDLDLDSTLARRIATLPVCTPLVRASHTVTPGTIASHPQLANPTSFALSPSENARQQHGSPSTGPFDPVSSPNQASLLLGRMKGVS